MSMYHAAPPGLEPASPPGLERDEAQALAGLVALFAITAAWWALALWPVENGPAWLERTRYVCFGVAASGLPDGGGWIGLIAGPLGMLGILVAGWYGGMRSLLLRARSSRGVAAALGALALGCMVLITGAGVRVQQVRAATTWLETDNAVPPATYPRLDRAAPLLVLTTQHGDVIDLANLAGTPVLVTFAYAHCTTVCPIVVSHTLRAQQALRDSGADAAVLIITLDPWRDTPSRLPAMAQSWGLPAAGAWVLSGAAEAVEATLDGWEVPRGRDLSTGEVTHPSLVYVVDRNGRIAYASTGGTDALVALVRRL
ncbi:MAG TPA: SCO family protein [Longimicrobiales bacterium]|nr:SCO family protein [Longimicrobiales bacterium]